MNYQQGTYIDNRYRLESRIDTGGFSEVWRVTDTQVSDDTTESDVALKLPRVDAHSSSKVESRFRREYRILKRLTATVAPRGVIRLLDGRISSDPYLATELISGTALDQVIMDTTGPELEHTARIGREVARTAAFLHQNDTLYLDLKPDNILIRQDDTPVFIDFNTAASRSEGDSTVLHADPFKPPEQTPPGNPKQIAAHTDVYALGAVLYALYTGSVPATEEYRSEGLDPARASGGTCSHRVRKVIRCATASDPANRYNDASELYIDLLSAQDCSASECWLENTQSDTEFPIQSGDTIGRATGRGTPAAISVPSEAAHISPVQCRFEHEQNHWKLHDRSTNGTYVRQQGEWKHILSKSGRRQLTGKGVLGDSKPPESIKLVDKSLVSPVDPEYDYTFKFRAP